MLGPRTLSPEYFKSQGPEGRGPKIHSTSGPRPLGPWDLRYLGPKVQGPKVRGSKAQGLMALEPLEVKSFTMEKKSPFRWNAA